MDQAEAGIKNFRQYVDSLVIIPNERLKQVSETRITLLNAFEIADSVLSRGVQSISDLINVPAYINLDFADVTSVMANAGYAHMGVGEATGKEKAEMAAKAAISSPLLETSIAGAQGILVNITASPDISMEEIDVASAMITSEAAEDANVIWGVAFDSDLEDKMKVTIIATGFENRAEDGEPEPKPTAEAAVSGADKENNEALGEEGELSALSDDDFNEIMNMLKKGRKGAEQPRPTGRQNGGGLY
jgi:cell division protein FtsZ